MKKRIISLVVTMLLIANVMCFCNTKAEACTTQGGKFVGWIDTSYSFINSDVHLFEGTLCYYCYVCGDYCKYNHSSTEYHTYLLAGDMRTLTCTGCGDSYGW